MSGPSRERDRARRRRRARLRRDGRRANRRVMLTIGAGTAVLIVALSIGKPALWPSGRRDATGLGSRTASVPLSAVDTRPPARTEGTRTGRSGRPATATAVVASSGTEAVTKSPERETLVVAWQPSHQDLTGPGWHEYKVCGDIVDRAMRRARDVKNVKVWDLDHGLYGSNNYKPQPTNTRPFDIEVAAANKARADVFISIHNDSESRSGILGLCMPGDSSSKEFAERLVRVVCKRTGLPSRGVWEVRLYSLEPVRNKARLRCILEVGDNVYDRRFLTSDEGLDRVAAALGEVVDSL